VFRKTKMINKINETLNINKKTLQNPIILNYILKEFVIHYTLHGALHVKSLNIENIS
jgi:hypothetical protein